MPTQELAVFRRTLPASIPAAADLHQRISLAVAALLIRRVAHAAGTPQNERKSLIDNMARRVREELSAAIQEGKTGTIDVLSRCFDDLQALQSQCKQSTSDVIDQIDDRIQSRLEQIENVLQQLQDETGKPAVEAVSRAASSHTHLSQWLNSSPSTTGIAQFSFGNSTTAVVKIKGVFPFVDQGRKVTLTIGENVLEPISVLTNEITFLISSDDLPPKSGVFQGVPAKLQFSIPPRMSLSPLRLLDDSKPPEFDISLLVLPQSPGTIRVEMTTTFLDHSPKRRCVQFGQWEKKTEQEVIRPPKGWEIVPGSVEIKSMGGLIPTVTIEGETPNITLKVVTGKKVGRARTAKYEVSYEERPIKPFVTLVTDKVFRDLDWDKTEKISLPPNTTCKVFFTDFNGEEIELDPRYSSHSLVQIRKGKDDVVILPQNPLKNGIDPASIPVAKF